MKKLTFLFAIAALAGLAFTNPVADVVTYTVNASESTVKWVAKKVTGAHEGLVSIQSGNLEYTDGLLSGGEFTIDMTSISVTDLKGEWADKLTGHLNSADFFDTANHPTATFTITSATSRGVDGAYKVKGDLTVKGITKSITLPTVQLTEGEDGITTTEALTIVLDRTDFDVRYGSGSFFSNLGDKTIYDDFELTVALKADK